MTMTDENDDADDHRDIEDEPPLEGQLVFKGPVDEDELGPERHSDRRRPADPRDRP